jgi:hypothetical protein
MLLQPRKQQPPQRKPRLQLTRRQPLRLRRQRMPLPPLKRYLMMLSRQISSERETKNSPFR